MTQPPSRPENAPAHQEPGGGHFAAPPPWNAPPPLKRGGPWRWVLAALALLAVITISVAVTVVYLRTDTPPASSDEKSRSSGSVAGVASANDTDPVAVITEDPTCAPWGPIINTVSSTENDTWVSRDTSIPATAWTPEQHALYQAVAQAQRSAADELVPLAKLTPHRALRELFEQYIAYARGYADSIPTYTAIDNNLNLVTTAIADTVNGICGAITYGSASARGPLVTPEAAPAHRAPADNPSAPTRFMDAADAQCAQWTDTANQLSADPAYTAWLKDDSSVPAGARSAQSKADNDAIIPVFGRVADVYATLGVNSSNPFMADAGTLAAQYLRAFVVAIPTYSPADIQLYNVFGRLPSLIRAACAAAGTH